MHIDTMQLQYFFFFYDKSYVSEEIGTDVQMSMYSLVFNLVYIFGLASRAQTLQVNLSNWL